MQRACLCALLKGGNTRLVTEAISADDAVMLNFIIAAGASVSKGVSGIQVEATDADMRGIRSFDFKDSGLAVRMCLPVLSLNDFPVEVMGSRQLRQRPMQFFKEILPRLGVSIISENDQLPMTVCGPLLPQSIEVDGSISSQFMTGLIMAYSAAGAHEVSITVKNLVSKPYLDLTLEVLRDFGLAAPIETSPAVYRFTAGSTKMSPAEFSYNIPGDWSSAAFMLVAGAIAGDLTLTGLDAFSAQGDKAILGALMDAGVSLSIMADRVRAQRSSLKAFHFNATDTPDLFPPLAVLAACARGTSVIEGISRLYGKESNRAETIMSVMNALGARISLQDDLMIVEGGHLLKGAPVKSFGDHRIAMMAAVAALTAEGLTTIEDSEAISKSYPAFFKDLQSAGAHLSSGG